MFPQGPSCAQAWQFRLWGWMLVSLAMTVFPTSNDSLLTCGAPPFLYMSGSLCLAPSFSWVLRVVARLLRAGLSYGFSRCLFGASYVLGHFNRSARPFRSKVQVTIDDFFSQSFAHLFYFGDGYLCVDTQPGGRGPFCCRG